MQVRRSITLNPIEPAPLSVRAAAAMETWLDVDFTDQRGQPYPIDLAAQLQLTGRSSDRTTTYPMPVTDMVNGKARAVIPAGDLTDMHGYRLRLLGTWNQQPALLAQGLWQMIPSAGFEAQPEDVIDSIPLAFNRGIDDYVDVALWHDAAKAHPYDVTTLTVIAPITLAAGGTTIDSFTVVKIAFNEVRCSLTGVQITALPASCWWSLIVSSGAGQQTLAQGPVTITG